VSIQESSISRTAATQGWQVVIDDNQPDIATRLEQALEHGKVVLVNQRGNPILVGLVGQERPWRACSCLPVEYATAIGALAAATPPEMDRH
jgi:hypothetical protein